MSTSTPSGGTGILIADYSWNNEYFNSVLVQPDGKIVTGGTSLSRYTSIGILDTTFSPDGMILLADFTCTSIALQSDGKILAAGFKVVDGDNDFYVVRYNADGTMDMSFTSDLGGQDRGTQVTVQPDGKILLVGSGATGSVDAYPNDYLALARHNADGSPDTSFGGDGTVTVAIDNVYGLDVAIQADGKILIAGGAGGNFLLVRLNVDGSLDNSFSGDGMLIADVWNTDSASSIVIQPDGKILLVGDGYIYNSGWHSKLTLARYNSDGTPDTSFNGDGTLVPEFGSYDGGSDAALQADGKILVAGSSDGVLTVFRFNADGSIDTSFSLDGKVTTKFGYGSNGASIAVQADGKIVVSGHVLTVPEESIPNAFVVRYNVDGSLDTSFAPTGETIAGTSDDDTLVGDSIFDNAVDTLRGLDGNDVLQGFGGVDTLDGGNGNDILIGGAGLDKLSGGQGNDTYEMGDPEGWATFDKITESANAGTDLVKIGSNYTLGSNLENLTLTGTESIEGLGNSLNNVITGNSGNNRLTGGGGNDTLNGSGGVDMLIGGIGNDIYITSSSKDEIIEQAGQGIDTVKSSVSYTLGSNLENLTLIGSSATNGTGNSFANLIVGNNAINTLSGSAGNDTLIGQGGRDRLSGGNGLDNFVFNATLNPSTNVDTITDFVAIDDSIKLENAIFSKLTVTGVLNAANFRANTTGVAADANDYIIYETDTGKVFYDADGNGAGAKVQFALIGTTTHALLTAADFVVI